MRVGEACGGAVNSSCGWFSEVESPVTLNTGPVVFVIDDDVRVRGLELQSRISAGDTAGAMPIIFITGFADVPTTVRAMKGGAIEFLTKPFDHNALLRAV